MSMFRRKDWTLFRNVATLGQRAGVAADAIVRLVAKELVDNALDSAGACDYGVTKGGGFFVADQGDGLPGDDAEIADLFSVARPLTSSKLLRLPTRGCLGNGLRVVAGAVLASGGELTVKTRGRALRLRPRDGDGGTDVEHVGPWKGNGTRIEVLLGDSLPVNDDLFDLADRAARLVGGQTYSGKTSPWWYDGDSFFELLQAGGARPVRELVAQFAGCTGGKAGKLAGAFNGRGCDGLTREQAEELLTSMRDGRPVNAKRLGCVGAQAFPDAGYAREVGTFKTEAARGGVGAEIPYVVEAWATAADKPGILFHVNRTPITAEIHASRCLKEKTLYGIVGCGLSNEQRNTVFPIKAGRRQDFSIVVNVTTPYMPITTDGKAPDLSIIRDAIRDASEKAIRRAKRKGAGNGQQQSQAAIIVGAIPAAIDKASGGGQYRYSLRQLFYAVRPRVIDVAGNEPDYGYFSRVVGEHEADNGRDLPGMYRDDRGTLLHPHTGERIPLGTRSVEAYRRPAWTFNKILYCEKEGFFPILFDAHWPERHDCALLTSKGYASRAVRDVLDLLGDGDEPLTFFCIHDADGPGTMIFQALQGATGARPARRVEIVNLGLDPAEAVDMGLPAERLKRKGKAVPVADYVDGEWREWLQENRVELNAMDTPTFLAWLDGKMEGQPGKLIPPAAVLTRRLVADTRALVHAALVDEAIRAARVDKQTAAAMRRLRPHLDRAAGRLLPTVRKTLAGDPAQQWPAPVLTVAEKLAGKVTHENGNEKG